MGFKEKYNKLEEEIENNKQKRKEKKLEMEKAQYTPIKKKLSLFIKDFIEVFHKRFHKQIATGNTYIALRSDFKTKDFRYQFSEKWGETTIYITTIDGIEKKSGAFRKKFIPELEIKIIRKVEDTDHGVKRYLERFESSEEKAGYKKLPEMLIKTYTDLEYQEDRWHKLNDSKIEHYLNIVNNDLEAWIDNKFGQILNN